MYLAVKLWEHIQDRPEGIPTSWPAETIELGASRVLPPGQYRLMTHTDFAAYKATRQHLYDAYLALLPVEEPPQE